MNTVANSDPRIEHVRVTEDEIIAQLADGRVISVPLAWSWRLAEATAAQRANFRPIGTGQGVHWPDVDEDISVEGMLHGTPARRPKPRPRGTGPRTAELDRRIDALDREGPVDISPEELRERIRNRSS